MPNFNEQAWLEGFINEAAAMGLDKQAAQELLKTAVRRELLETNPAFAEGFQQELEKLAMPPPVEAALLGAVRSLGKGIPGGAALQTRQALRADPARALQIANMQAAAKTMRGGTAGGRTGVYATQPARAPIARPAPAPLNEEAISKIVNDALAKNLSRAAPAAGAGVPAIPTAAAPAAAASAAGGRAAPAGRNFSMAKLLALLGVGGGATLGGKELVDRLRTHIDRSPEQQQLVNMMRGGLWSGNPEDLAANMHFMVGQQMANRATRRGGNYFDPSYNPQQWMNIQRPAYQGFQLGY